MKIIKYLFVLLLFSQLHAVDNTEQKKGLSTTKKIVYLSLAGGVVGGGAFIIFGPAGIVCVAAAGEETTKFAIILAKAKATAIATKAWLVTAAPTISGINMGITGSKFAWWGTTKVKGTDESRLSDLKKETKNETLEEKLKEAFLA